MSMNVNQNTPSATSSLITSGLIGAGVFSSIAACGSYISGKMALKNKDTFIKNLKEIQKNAPAKNSGFWAKISRNSIAKSTKFYKETFRKGSVAWNQILKNLPTAALQGAAIFAGIKGLMLLFGGEKNKEV